MKIVIALTLIVGLLSIMNFIGKTSLEAKANKPSHSQIITPFDSHMHKAGELWRILASN